MKLVTDLNADVILFNRARFSLSSSVSIPLRQVVRAEQCQGVDWVEPLYLESRVSRLRSHDTASRLIRVIAFDPAADLFLNQGIRRQQRRIKDANQALIDVRSKSAYGVPLLGNDFHGPELAELSGHRIKVVGGFRMGTDFANEGNLVVSDREFAQIFPQRGDVGNPLSSVDLGIVKCQPGIDPQQVATSIATLLDDSTIEVMTKPAFVQREISFWRSSTPIGIMFGIGTVLGFVVGVIICYQVIYNDIADNLSEFATLKAMGYGLKFFVRYVLMEAVYLTILGFLPGVIVSVTLYRAVANRTGLLMDMKLSTAVFVFTLTLAMCIFSGGLALRRLLTADPADNF